MVGKQKEPGKFFFAKGPMLWDFVHSTELWIMDDIFSIKPVTAGSIDTIRCMDI